MSLKKAQEFIREHDNFLITTHTNLEGDALGSELAFGRILKKLGKRAIILDDDDLPYGYDFLSAKDEVKKFKKGKSLEGLKFDCLAVLDCSDLKRAGEVWTINSAKKKPVLNIDHHISNSRFADVNWVDPAASSCAEMIYRLHNKLGLDLDKDTALFLYTGILTDTGSFRYSNTTSFTHKAVSDLMRYGIDTRMIYKKIYQDVPFEDMKLLVSVLPDLRLAAGGKIAYCAIRRDLLENKKLSFDLTEHILSFSRAIKGVEVCALFKENLSRENEVRLNLRSEGKVDVNKIASFFGGGGHKTASGATVKGDIDQVRRKVLARIKEGLNDSYTRAK